MWIQEDKKAHLTPLMNDTMADQSEDEAQRNEEQPEVSSVPPTPAPQTPPPQQQHTDPASPTVATTPEPAPVPVACANKELRKSSEAEQEYDVGLSVFMCYFWLDALYLYIFFKTKLITIG